MATLRGSYPSESELQKRAAPQAPHVFYATHDGSRNKLPEYKRAFISFSFGGKDIEDFGLIVTFGSGWLDRSASAEFEDLTSSYDILDGETYHGTHFRPYTLSLTLATDGMTEKQLEQFRTWFRGGMTRDLVLAEHPNRFICARVSSPPQLHLIPFEMPIDVQVTADTTYRTSSTLYKGTIELSFVSSDPFWQAYAHVIGTWEEEGQEGKNTFLPQWKGKSWRDEEGMRATLSKVVYEDNIPLPELAADISAPVGFGETGTQQIINEAYSSGTSIVVQKRGTDTSLVSNSSPLPMLNTGMQYKIIEKSHRPLALASGVLSQYDTCIVEIIDTEPDPNNIGEFKYDGVNYRGARIMGTTAVEVDSSGYSIRGYVSGSNIVDAYDYPQELGPEEDGTDVVYNDYNGNSIGSNGTRGLLKANNTSLQRGFYFFYGGTAPTPAIITFELPIQFVDGYVSSIANQYCKYKGKSQSTFTIYGQYKKQISMTAPNMIMSYNKVIYLFKNLNNINSVVELEEQLRDFIRHPRVRAFALEVLKKVNAVNNSQQLVDEMKTFWPEDANDAKVEIIIDSSKSKATGKYKYYKNLTNVDDNKVSTTTEDIGDAMRTTWYYIEDRNEYMVDSNGKMTIGNYNKNHPEYLHKVTSNFPVTVRNFWISYEYMYL